MLMKLCRNFANAFRKWKTLERFAEFVAKVCGISLRFPKPNKFFINFQYFFTSLRSQAAVAGAATVLGWTLGGTGDAATGDRWAPSTSGCRCSHASRWKSMYKKQAKCQCTEAKQCIKIPGGGIFWAGKLYMARSRLYRSRFLQPNIRLKALIEIYTMHSFAPLSCSWKTMKSCKIYVIISIFFKS